MADWFALLDDKKRISIANMFDGYMGHWCIKKHGMNIDSLFKLFIRCINANHYWMINPKQVFDMYEPPPLPPLQLADYYFIDTWTCISINPAISNEWKKN